MYTRARCRLATSNLLAPAAAPSRHPADCPQILAAACPLAAARRPCIGCSVCWPTGLEEGRDDRSRGCRRRTGGAMVRGRGGGLGPDRGRLTGASRAETAVAAEDGRAAQNLGGSFRGCPCDAAAVGLTVGRAAFCWCA